jgi:hypothetical protein
VSEPTELEIKFLPCAKQQHASPACVSMFCINKWQACFNLPAVAVCTAAGTSTVFTTCVAMPAVCTLYNNRPLPL